MAFADNIVGALIIVIIFVLSGIILFSDLTEMGAESLKETQRVYGAEMDQTALNSFLGYTHSSTNIPMRMLIGRALVEGKSNLDIGNTTLNMTELVENSLDIIVGKDKYYLDAEWDVAKLTLSFVLDGSPTVEVERTNLANILVSLVEETEALLPVEGSVTIQVFILTEESFLCDEFDSLGVPWLTCQAVGRNDLYEQTRQPYSDLNPPTISGYNTLEDWEDMNPALPVNSITEADWASGAVYASYWFDDQSSNNVSWLHLIFPLSDEFSTSSVPDLCFDQQERRWIEKSYAWVCSICYSKCDNSPGSPASRSLDSINRALPILLEKGDIVNPVYSFDCDYDPPAFLEAPAFRTRKTTDDFGPYSGSWCSSSGCTGCSGSRPNICFQPDQACQDEIKNQMEYLASQTGGITVSLTSVEELKTKIKEMVVYVLENNPHAIRAGTKHALRDRYIIRNTIYLPNGKSEEVELWVYQ